MALPFRAVLLAILFAGAAYGYPDDHRINVVCLGDSITAGAGVENKKTESYPAQLQQLLGEGYAVTNLGLGGATLLRSGSPTAWSQLPALAAAQPDVIVVILGTNDTHSGSRRNWEKIESFDKDTEDLLETLTSLPGRPQVLLGTPTSMVLETPGLSEDRRADLEERHPRLANLRRRLATLAEEWGHRGVALLDLEPVLKGQPDLVVPGDGVHPNAKGYQQIAKALEKAVIRAGRGSVPVKVEEGYGRVRYDDFVWVTAHNAMSTAADQWIAPNQNRSMTDQLRAGVRGLMLDVHESEEGPVLYHGKSWAGSRPFVDGLVEIRSFLESDPNAIVTLILENYVTGEALTAAFEEAGMASLLHTQKKNHSWPSLGAMQRSGKRLVVLTEKGQGEAPWLLPLWEWCWDTHWSAKTLEDFTSKPHRGAVDHDLFILNHFLTNPLASQALARQANAPSVLARRLLNCHGEHGRWPSFLTVDFEDEGAAHDIAASLNRGAGVDSFLDP